MFVSFKSGPDGDTSLLERPRGATKNRIQPLVSRESIFLGRKAMSNIQ